uniref:Uncharacterized protein n=1 Tax=Mola mola TaxID=94237 RepID=A0A3Q3XIV8_MOLML
MAAVRAELRRRDGVTEEVSVAVGNNLSSVIGGIHELSASVSRLLTGLVEQDKGRGDDAQGEPADTEEEDSDGDDGEPETPPNAELQPPSKRSRT